MPCTVRRDAYHTVADADALSSALATILSVTDEGSTSSFSTRFLLIAQVVVNSGNAKRPPTADSTSKCRRTFPPVTSHVSMHEVGADRPDFEQKPRSAGRSPRPRS